MSEHNVNLCYSSLSSINKKNVEEDNGNYCNPCQQCVTCKTFFIVSSRMSMSTLSSVNKN